MKHVIKHRYTDAVLFEGDVPEDMESGLRTRAVLEQAVSARANLAGAYLAGANLAGANLAGAYLDGAYLDGAYLDGAKWTDKITITQRPIQLYGLQWPVTVLDQHMQIGCQLHPLHDWEQFDDKTIVEMDGRDALRFWRAHKEALLGLARGAGRSFAKVEA